MQAVRDAVLTCPLWEHWLLASSFQGEDEEAAGGMCCPGAWATPKTHQSPGQPLPAWKNQSSHHTGQEEPIKRETIQNEVNLNTASTRRENYLVSCLE